LRFGPRGRFWAVLLPKRNRGLSVQA
jgi:hypothetical protein